MYLKGAKQHEKIIATVVIVAACGALCARVWPLGEAGRKVLLSAQWIMPEAKSTPAVVPMAENIRPSMTHLASLRPPSVPEPTKSPKPKIPTASKTAYCSDPYHTDVYPENEVPAQA